MPQITIPNLREKRANGEPIVMVTAYDYPAARAAERAGVDLVLVGDSGAQVVLGYPSTVPVSTDEMLMMAKAVRRGTESALLVSDVPFGSTEESDAQAVATAVRFAKEAGVDAVKLEGGNASRLSRIRAIVDAGIPVVAHIGLTPQTATALGGLRAQGRTTETAERLVREAFAVAEAGAFLVVIEAVPTGVADVLRDGLPIPIIGIGAGPAHGQVLVLHDLLGVTEGNTAKFVKRFGSIGDDTVAALSSYAAEVRSGAFPGAEHQYSASDEAVAAARAALAAAQAR
ncbi:3-methyl-2-oxobutanoate hydroxymethyltransferase [Leucobacter rhizosphaerae]|uniref:3-methyl-2-oxobutanoate hydroxymethyltransferase n=1 Tax=Leucobacter rhizosphaerae TaxID=2932245 RepID=A0ABY4FZS0_9MICO|nr:3-methyl-2-oxobutanoate hydroxymethyltransferase [Leucobacter rhizosphaerae]UOQ61767.1 3-methyl-2-oxobutanoate hydroxymethyltransferase [Leucobacter rhizosphaerae]